MCGLGPELPALSEFFEDLDEFVAANAVLDGCAHLAPDGLAVFVDDEDGGDRGVVVGFQDLKGTNCLELGVRDEGVGHTQLFGERGGVFLGVRTHGDDAYVVLLDLVCLFGQLSELVATPSSPVSAVEDDDGRAGAVDVIDVPGPALLVLHGGRGIGISDA